MKVRITHLHQTALQLVTSQVGIHGTKIFEKCSVISPINADDRSECFPRMDHNRCDPNVLFESRGKLIICVAGWTNVKRRQVSNHEPDIDISTESFAHAIVNNQDASSARSAARCPPKMSHILRACSHLFHSSRRHRLQASNGFFECELGGAPSGRDGHTDRRH